MNNMLDKNRIIRTSIQAACGAGISFCTAIAADFSKEAIISALVGAVSTVAVSILMNIQKQVNDDA